MFKKVIAPIVQKMTILVIAAGDIGVGSLFKKVITPVVAVQSTQVDWLTAVVQKI